jgi:SNF2 family DNA or RNA helicase
MKFNLELYPYQAEDVEFMKTHPRCLNRNFMGSGKSIEAIALCDELKLRHILIVCKKTMIGNWFWEISKWSDGDCLTPHENTQYDHKLAGLDLSAPRFVCVNYDLIAMPKYRELLQSVPWDIIIYDEAHALKNHDAKRTRAAYTLSYRAPRVVFLTGTPIRNTPLDLFPLFHQMNPREYRNWRQWRDWFCITEEDEIWLRGPSGKPYPRYIKRILPGVKNAEQLRQLLNLYSVYHDKKDILTQLPPKQYRQVPIELGPERAQYETMKDEYFALLDSGVEITAPAAIAQLTRLRQICCDPNTLLPEPPRTSTPSNKTLALLDVIDETDGKLVVFTCFERYAQLLYQELEAKGIAYRTITGQVKADDRLKAELDFQNDPQVKVLVGTIGAMGEGLTLTAADTVVFADLFWTPAVNEQCEDRVYGRVDKGLTGNKSILVIDLFCHDTVEEHVHAVVRAKEAMIDKVVMSKVVDRMRKEG